MDAAGLRAYQKGLEVVMTQEDLKLLETLLKSGKIQGKLQSSYCYKGKDVLINKFNCTNPDELQKKESFFSERAITRILANPSVAINQFGINLLSTLHYFLFGKTYDWAGKPRTEPIAKGGTEFSDPKDVPYMLKAACDHIKEQNNYKGQSLGELVHSLASTHANLNLIHPFREGNGRTIRLFMTLLARYNGYDLNYALVPKQKQIQADNAALVYNDCTALANMYNNIILYPPEVQITQKIHIIGGDKCPNLLSPYIPPQQANIATKPLAKPVSKIKTKPKSKALDR